MELITKKRNILTIQLKCVFNTCKIYNIIYNEQTIGGVELYDYNDHIYIENIYIDKEFRGHGLLREILKQFCVKPLKCLPLKQHVKKFEHLGFQVCEIQGSDIYYMYNEPKFCN